MRSIYIIISKYWSITFIVTTHLLSHISLAFWSNLVYFSSLDSIWSIGSNLAHFGLFWSTLFKSVHLGHFSPYVVGTTSLEPLRASSLFSTTLLMASSTCVLTASNALKWGKVMGKYMLDNWLEDYLQSSGFVLLH